MFSTEWCSSGKEAKSSDVSLRVSLAVVLTVLSVILLRKARNDELCEIPFPELILSVSTSSAMKGLVPRECEGGLPSSAHLDLFRTLISESSKQSVVSLVHADISTLFSKLCAGTALREEFYKRLVRTFTMPS